jgi:hypothetical protein
MHDETTKRKTIQIVLASALPEGGVTLATTGGPKLCAEVPGRSCVMPKARRTRLSCRVAGPFL